MRLLVILSTFILSSCSSVGVVDTQEAVSGCQRISTVKVVSDSEKKAKRELRKKVEEVGGNYLYIIPSTFDDLVGIADGGIGESYHYYQYKGVAYQCVPIEGT
jgi:hypothetical protein